MRNKRTAERDPLTYRIIGCGMQVHTELGPGLVESVYDDCLAHALTSAGLSIERHPRLSVSYEGAPLARQFRPDFVVEKSVVVEVKSVAHLLPLHEAQLLTYMKLSRIERGLLVNFNVARLMTGIRRMILTST